MVRIMMMMVRENGEDNVMVRENGEDNDDDG